MSAPASCNKCKLHLSRKSVVNGEGKWFQPKLFIVGEAPGREEDDSGKPFVGGSGRILAALLSSAGISKSDCYLTNVCRCRPPNNRTPELDEVFSCQSYLADEIGRVNPELIVALGETASELLTGKNVTTWRGSIVQGIGPAAGRRVLVTYHPAFVMRMRSMFPVVAWDLRKALILQPEVPEDYVVNPSREVLEELLESYTTAEVAVDIETGGDEDDEVKAALNPWGDTFEIIGISFTPKAGQALHLSGRYMVMNWDLLDAFLSSHEKLIYHNNTFDRCALWVKRGYLTKISWDSLNGMHLINPALPKKLDFVRSVYTNMEPYKAVYKTGGKYRPGQLSSEALARLNCLDTDATWRGAQAQKEFVTSGLMQDILEEDDIAIKMRYRGILVDKNRVAYHYARLLPKLEAFETSFDSRYSVSISSPKQLNKLLYDDFKFPTYDKDGKSCFRAQASTCEKAIQAIGSAIGLVYLNDEDGERFEGEADNKEILAEILEYRGLAKIASTYCEGVFKALDSKGFLHPQWNTAVTDTGRWSCRGTPMQGFPEDLRDTIIAEPGHIFLGADFKGMQIMGAAIMAEDWELAEAMLDPDYSIHNEVLEAIKPYYPSIKKIQAKTVVFGTFFGRTPKSIAAQFHVPVKTAQLWQEIFYSLRPKLKAMFEEKLPQFWKDHGYAIGVTGRKKYCEVVTEAKNHPVQNFESVVVKNAMKTLNRHKHFNDLRLMIHDQLVIQLEDEGPSLNDEKYQEFRHILETSGTQYFRRFPVEGGWGANWYEVK